MRLYSLFNEIIKSPISDIYQMKMWYLQSITRNDKWHLKSGVYDNIFELFTNHSHLITNELIKLIMLSYLILLLIFMGLGYLDLLNRDHKKEYLKSKMPETDVRTSKTDVLNFIVVLFIPLAISLIIFVFTIRISSENYRYNYYEYENTALINNIEDNHRESTQKTKKINVYLESFKDPIILDKSNHKHLKEGDNVVIRTPSELYDEDKNMVAYTSEVMKEYRNHIKVIKENS